ncbi:MAG: type I methionyl aminopeptidase [Brevinematales bacterium]|nr:type I methionyl aminopeptidase [Brevinematales bacterium]
MILLKNSIEIEYIRKSNQIIASIFRLLHPHVRPGVKTAEIDKVIEDMILSRGGRPSFKGYTPGGGFRPYPAASCISVNEVVIHGVPGDYQLRSGDIVSIDIGVDFHGYYGDASYTYLVGEVSERDKKLVEDTKKALDLAIEICHEGVYLNEIGRVISSYLLPKGYGILRDYCGHGVGKALHEDPPVLNYYDPKRKGPKLKKGMVIAIEPMVTLGTHEVRVLSDGWSVVTKDGSRAAHWEHSIAITDGEPVILSAWE